MSILISDAWMLPQEGFLKQKYDILVEGEYIAKIAPAGTIKCPAAKVIQGNGSLALPGFVNAHTHSAMSLLRGYGDDMPLMSWLNDRVWPLEAKMTPEDVYWGSLLSCLEMIKSGTTAFADMYFFMDSTAKAVEESGLRASLSAAIIDGETKDFQEKVELARIWQGKADGRITTMLGPHSSYTCSPARLQEVMEAADEYDLAMHIHIAETQSEIEQIEAAYGKRTVQHLENLGFFAGHHVLGAHLVWLNAAEIDILAQNGVCVAHNPQSNMKLASGIAPVPAMLQAGIKVALGTDSSCSNNSLDMLAEMKAAALLAKVGTLDATALPAAKVIEMATENGAAALDLPQVGKLEPGYKADLILLDMNKPHLAPLHDLASQVVYAANGADVKTTLVNGQVLMQDYEVLVLDEAKILSEVKKCCKNLFYR